MPWYVIVGAVVVWSGFMFWLGSKYGARVAAKEAALEKLL